MSKELPFQILEGATVTLAEIVHDYVQFAFGKEVGVSIYNDWSIIPEKIKFQDLVGKIVDTVLEDEVSIIFKFLDGTQLTVDMHRQAYHGPEALQLNRRGLPPVIWN